MRPKVRVSRLLGAVAVVSGLTVGMTVAPAAVTSAQPGSYLVGITEQENNRAIMYVHSASMDTIVPLEIQRSASSAPSPVLYLLNGANGGMNGESWQYKTDVYDYLANKSINLVSPVAGRSSYYTDWRFPDPVIGVNKWTTFLTEELPPIVNQALNANGKNSIAGLSASGTSVLSLAEYKPELYRSVAAFSGCANTSDVRGQLFVRLTVELFGGANTFNMWGPPTDPAWAANDPYIHAERLRGVDLFIASGGGLPGQYDVYGGEYALPGVDGIVQQYALGTVIEAAVRDCTIGMQRRLAELNIPATFRLPPTGTHSWGYWRDDLIAAWSVIANSVDIPV